MQVVSRGQSLWIYLLIFILLQLWGRLSASTSSPPIPAPELTIHLRSEDSVVLVCQVPEGHRGVLFLLYRSREQVDSQQLQSGADAVRFTVRVKKVDPVQSELFCCLYKDQDGHYSAFSPYLQLEQQRGVAPPQSTPSYPPPVLSVQPSTGVVKRGDMLSFSCLVSTFQPQSQSRNNKRMTFFLLRDTEGTGVTSIVLKPPASQVSSPEPRPGVFTVGPVVGGEEGTYSCMYQITNKRGLVNSSVSNMVQITVAEVLPVPTLVLQRQTDVWHLLCTGSPHYPGALFSLFLADNDLPVTTRQTTLIHHQATFPVPVQDTPVAAYQCQYSVLLGKKWSSSERSLPLAVTKGTSPPSPPDVPAVDWPLILGSVSAVVLFLCSAALVAVVVHRKVKAAAEEKKKRRDAQFWTRVHAKDHVIDLTLRRTSFTSQEWATMDSSAETAPRSPLWNSHSTFTTPIY